MSSLQPHLFHNPRVHRDPSDGIFELLNQISTAIMRELRKFDEEDLTTDPGFKIDNRIANFVRNGIRDVSSETFVLSNRAPKKVEPSLITDEEISDLVLERLGLLFAKLAHDCANRGLNEFSFGSLAKFNNRIVTLIQDHIPVEAREIGTLADAISHQFRSSKVRNQLSGSWGKFEIDPNGNINMLIFLERSDRTPPARAKVEDIDF